MALTNNALAFYVLQLVHINAWKTYDDTYEYSGDYQYVFPSNSCQRDWDCPLISEHCCTRSGTCCDKTITTYDGAKTKCRRNFMHGGLNTDVECPPAYDTRKIFCCRGGYGCCSADDLDTNPSYSRPDREKNSLDHSGVTSMGAVAGFVCIAIIVVGTLLTLATRFIKIKVRRDHRRAGIQSQAYLDAINRRLNGPSGSNQVAVAPSENEGHNSPQDASQQCVPDIFLIENNAEDSEGDEEDVSPPPTYDEAMATSHVVVAEVGRAETSPETQLSNFQFMPPTRPTRGQRETSEAIPLSVKKDDYDPIQESGAETLPGEATFITMSKADDSYA